MALSWHTGEDDNIHFQVGISVNYFLGSDILPLHDFQFHVEVKNHLFSLLVSFKCA